MASTMVGPNGDGFSTVNCHYVTSAATMPVVLQPPVNTEASAANCFRWDSEFTAGWTINRAGA